MEVSLEDDLACARARASMIDDEYITQFYVVSTFKTCMKLAKNGITQVIHRGVAVNRVGTVHVYVYSRDSCPGLRKRNSIIQSGREGASSRDQALRELARTLPSDLGLDLGHREELHRKGTNLDAEVLRRWVFAHIRSLRKVVRVSATWRERGC